MTLYDRLKFMIANVHVDVYMYLISIIPYMHVHINEACMLHKGYNVKCQTQKGRISSKQGCFVCRRPNKRLSMYDVYHDRGLVYMYLIFMKV